jgi:acetyltransferase
MGFVVPGERLGLWSSDLPVPFPAGNISAVFQSSGVLTLFLRQVVLRGLGFRIAVATGNQAALTLEDYLSYVVEDPETKLIILYVEAITKPRDLVGALDRALELEKPVIAMRVGKTDRSRRNVVAHTGNLAATGMAWDAILQQKGVTLVGNFDEFIEAIVLFSGLSARRPIAQDGVGLISVSGGDCSFLSDLSERVGVLLPDISPASRKKIGDYLGKSTLLGNPLDIENLRRQNEAGFYESIELFMSEPSLEVVGCRLTLPTKPSEGVKEDCRRIAQLAEAHQKLLIFMSRGSEGVDAEWLEFFAGLGIPFIQEYERGLKAIKAWLRYRELCQRKNRSVKGAVTPNDRLTSLRASIGQHRQRVLPYELGTQLLSAYGIPAVAGGLALTPDAAREMASRIGFPVALKVASADVPHKSDIGAVALNVETADGLERGFRRVVEAARKAVPQAIVEGVVVQKMVRGVEVIVGVYKEPGLGPVVMFGLGGVFVEVLKDVSFRCPPFGLDAAYEMINEIRGKAVLQGVRGLPRADIAALANAIWRLSHLALDFDDEIDQLEVNPLIVLGEGQGVAAVDVLAVAQQE